MYLNNQLLYLNPKSFNASKSNQTKPPVSFSQSKQTWWSHPNKKKTKQKQTNYNNTIKDAPSLCDKTPLIEKQKVDVRKPRVFGPVGS
jgi:hypothetical protein